MNSDKHSILSILYIVCMLQYILCGILLVLKYKYDLSKNKDNNNLKISYSSFFSIKKFDIISIPIISSWLIHAVCIIFPWIIYGIYFGIGHVLSIISWVGLGLYLCEKRHPNMHTMQFIMICMSAFCVSLPYLFSGNTILDLSIDVNTLTQHSKILYDNFYIFLLHFLCMNITYAILIWICVHIFIMISLEKNLHNPQQHTYKFLHKCPPLLHMQSILKQRLYVLWYFMTFVIITGIYLWVKEDLSYITHKIIFSLCSWVLFLVFLYKKYKSGISSKKTM
ncbi:MAG: hypothetical protein RLZZ210_1186, partial [Pseudomonadota bacterium]